MRDQLIRELQERVGLDREMAEKAADVALDFIKSRGPQEIQQLLGGQGGMGGLLGR